MYTIPPKEQPPPLFVYLSIGFVEHSTPGQALPPLDTALKASSISTWLNSIARALKQVITLWWHTHAYARKVLRSLAVTLAHSQRRKLHDNASVRAFVGYGKGWFPFSQGRAYGFVSGSIDCPVTVLFDSLIHYALQRNQPIPTSTMLIILFHSTCNTFKW